MNRNTRELLPRLGAALYGPHFKRPLAAALNVRLDTVGRWCSGREVVPSGVLVELVDLLNAKQVEIINIKFEVTKRFMIEIRP